MLTSNVKCGAAARSGRAAMACSASGAGAGVATGDGAARRRRCAASRRRCGRQRGVQRRCGAATALRGEPVTVRPEGRALRSRRSVKGKQASTMATVRVPVEAGLRGCNPATCVEGSQDGRVNGPLCFIASLADGSYAARVLVL